MSHHALCYMIKPRLLICWSKSLLIKFLHSHFTAHFESGVCCVLPATHVPLEGRLALLSPPFCAALCTLSTSSNPTRDYSLLSHNLLHFLIHYTWKHYPCHTEVTHYQISSLAYIIHRISTHTLCITNAHMFFVWVMLPSSLCSVIQRRKQQSIQTLVLYYMDERDLTHHEPVTVTHLSFIVYTWITFAQL